uniref:Uncharacterized protein n=1 Tax=Chloropicon primus TaxID=1764295 RepID=A0A7S2T4A8_9CHLO
MASRSSGFGRGRWARFALVAWACVTLLAVSATAGSGVDEATKRMQEFMRARQRQQRESLERMREWEKANLGGSGGGRAEITVLSEVPLTTATEMASSSSDASARRTSRSSTSSTRGGGSGSSTYTYSSSSSSSSSSFSRSSTRAAGEVKSSDRVGIAVQTPEVDIVFNVGPALENLGIRVTPRSEPAAVARGLEEEAFSVEPPAAEPGRPSRILIEDGADISQVGNGYPTLNIELETPLFNFTYVESEESGESTYTVSRTSPFPSAATPH